jgi:tetratricopeptide (TPR) repeat protein
MGLLATAWLTAGCGAGSGGPERGSAVVITLDTTRADALGCYGGPAGVTPHLDRLASESLLFEHARTVAPLTQPAHASMFTGLYPPRMGVRVNGAGALPESARTLAELSCEAGVRTAAFLASAALDATCGLDQGFEVYSGPGVTQARELSGYVERPAAAVVDEALTWLERRDRSEPFLLWVHLFDPHRPLKAPSGFVRRAGGDPYLGEVAVMDHAVGRLLDALRAEGVLDELLVVVVSDHGESNGEHGEATHGALCYGGTIDVPLLVRLPSTASAPRRGVRVDSLVSVVDVFPTVAAHLGLETPTGLDGVDLAGPLDPARGVYFESYQGFLFYGWSPLAGWADREGTYLHSSGPELLAGPAGATGTADRYRRAIDAVHAAPALEVGPAEPLDAATARMLASLGYSSSAVDTTDLPHPLAPSDLPAPSTRARELERYDHARVLVGTGKPDEAMRLLQQILGENPGHASANYELGQLLVQAERWSEALAPLRRATEVGRDWYAPHHLLGVALEQLNRPGDARTEYARAAELDGRFVPALEALERIAEDAGEKEQARQLRERIAALRAASAN